MEVTKNIYPVSVFAELKTSRELKEELEAELKTGKGYIPFFTHFFPACNAITRTRHSRQTRDVNFLTTSTRRYQENQP